jgi:hypothetical protein
MPLPMIAMHIKHLTGILATEAQALRTPRAKTTGVTRRPPARLCRGSRGTGTMQTETISVLTVLEAGYNIWLERGILPDWLIRIGGQV